jgi:pimeloyl-ACP methyl ester carboxylesterase
MNSANRSRRPLWRGILIALAAIWLILGIAVRTSSAGGQQVVPFGTQATLSLPNCTHYPSGGAIHFFCTPTNWNGSLIVYAHGYVSPEEQSAPSLPAEAEQIAQLVQPLGFAFATTSFPDRGLVVPGGVADLVTLVSEFKSQYPLTRNTFLVGASEGGLITAKAVERHENVFSGGLACCGPVGDFRKQIDYFGDFFVVFNYFFPGVFPAGTGPGGVPGDVIDRWETDYIPKVHAAITADPARTSQLLRVTDAPVDPTNPASVEQTVLGVLWYNVFATNDALAKLGGQPFDNSLRWYRGSSNDWALNRGVQRFRAHAAALQTIQNDYQTTGRLKRPLVMLHTLADPIVPYWHEPLYWWKALLSGSLQHHVGIPILRYGHCNFTPQELLGAFALLVWKVTGQRIPFSF